MAADEAVFALLEPGQAVLRHYRWLGRAASFGYSQSLADARSEAPGFDLVRRWTGGGVVRHDADWTFSLAVSRVNPFAGLRAQESYCAIHGAVAGALAGPARLAGAADVRGGLSCFSAPALDDIMAPGGLKICGGAQRRTRAGILHQGSIQNATVPDGFLRSFARRLAAHVEDYSPPQAFAARLAGVRRERYGNPGWSAKVP